MYFCQFQSERMWDLTIDIVVICINIIRKDFYVDDWKIVWEKVFYYFFLYIYLLLLIALLLLLLLLDVLCLHGTLQIHIFFFYIFFPGEEFCYLFNLFMQKLFEGEGGWKSYNTIFMFMWCTSHVAFL